MCSRVIPRVKTQDLLLFDRWEKDWVLIDLRC